MNKRNASLVSRSLVSCVCTIALYYITGASIMHAEITADETKRLSTLLKSGVNEKKLSDDEIEEVESLILKLLPDKGADNEAVEWKIRYNQSEEESQNDLITLDLYKKGDADGDKLMWFHMLYHKKADRDYGSEKFGRYGAMRFKDRHLFTMVGKLEIRAVAGSSGYESDKKIDAVVNAMDLSAIRKL